MRIALATYSTRPRGGVVHTLALAEALAALGHEVAVWTLARGGDEGFFRPVDPAVTVHAVAVTDIEGEPLGPRVVRSIAALGEAFDPGAADIVHAQDCISANALPGCIRTVHHLDTFTTPELVACHERAIVTPRALLCVSSAVAAELAAGWELTATVIPNGVDAARFEAAAGAAPAAVDARAAWRHRLGGDPLVVTVGGIEPRKGSLDLLRAVDILRERRPGARAAVGGGETLFDHRAYRASFDAEADLLDAPIDILGPLDHTDLPAFVAAADVFAFPSTKEGFGLAAMEALAAGVPVVVRDLPVFHEVFGDAVTYGDDPISLATALDDASAEPDPARAAAGRSLARAHTWTDAAVRHVAFYESLS